MTVQPGFLDMPAGRRYLAREMSTHRVLPSPSPAQISQVPRCARKASVTLRSKSAPALRDFYETLLHSYGPQNWWPARSRFEVIVGAILTQNTSWTNVERAIVALRAKKLLSTRALRTIPETELAELIRPSGYFRQKARKLKAFLEFLDKNYRGSLRRMFRMPTQKLRAELLSVYGIGPETADSILLYAGGHPVFVVDAYSRRLLARHELARGDERYDEIRELFERSLPTDPQLFNEYHALIVHTGKHFCRKRDPRCGDCALRSFLPAAFLQTAIQGAR